MRSFNSFLNTKINLIALTFCALSTGFWMLVLAQWYYYFLIAGPGAWSTAFGSQTIWCLLHGSFSPSTLGANFITDHCSFLILLFAPLYWIWPDPMLLLYLKIGAFMGGAYIFFLILKRYLHPLIALGAMIAFTLAPANISMLYSPFYYEPFSIPLVFLIFKALDDNKFWPYIIFCFLLAMVKEQMPLLVIMFGVFSFFFKKESKVKWALIPILMGLGIFIFEVFVLTPSVCKDLSLSQSYYWTRYFEYGKTPTEILLFLFTHPLVIYKALTSPVIIKWYNDLFGIWGGLAFFSPHLLLVAFPLFLKNILSNDHLEHQVSIAYYSATFTPFIFLAVWNTLNHIENKWRLSIHSLVLVLMFVHAWHDITPAQGWPNTRITTNTLTRIRFIDKIPPNASVLSDWITLAPLANRNELYLFQNYLTGSYYISGRNFQLPKNTDYLLLDLSDEWLLNTNPKRYIPKMTALNFNTRWRLQESIEDIALYVQNPSGQKAERLIDRSYQPFPMNNIDPQTFDTTITLETIKFPKVFPQQYRIFPVTMYWKCLKRTRAAYAISINIISSNGEAYYSKYRSIGTTIYPTYFWHKGEYIKESYFYLLPHMPQGNFDMIISIYNPLKKERVGTIKYTFTT